MSDDPTRPDPAPDNPTSAPQPEQPASGRDSNGRFTQNNKGGPGNPYARQVAHLRQRMLERLSDEQFDRIFDKLRELAEGGNVQAMKLLLSYAAGRPAAAADPDTIDVHELEVLKKRCVPGGIDLASCVQGIPVELVCVLVEMIRPIVAEGIQRTVREALLASVEQDRLDAIEDDEDEPVQEQPAS